MNLQFRLKKPIPFIFEHLSDMPKFISVHPVISKMVKTGKDSYLVHETLKFGFIPFSFTYPVHIEDLSEENMIIFRAKVFKLTKIKMQFYLEANEEFTTVTEQIDFKTVLPIKWLLKKTFKEQHQKLFKNIEEA